MRGGLHHQKATQTQQGAKGRTPDFFDSGSLLMLILLILLKLVTTDNPHGGHHEHDPL